MQSYKSLAIMGDKKFKQIVVGVVGVHIKCRGFFERSSTEFKVEPIRGVGVVQRTEWVNFWYILVFSNCIHCFY